MDAGEARAASGRGRLSGLWDELKASFGAPAGLAMLAGVVLGFGLPAIDNLLCIDIPTFSFKTQDAATGLLQTIATVTVAVAGLAFSVGSSLPGPRYLQRQLPFRTSRSLFLHPSFGAAGDLE